MTGSIIFIAKFHHKREISHKNSTHEALSCFKVLQSVTNPGPGPRIAFSGTLVPAACQLHYADNASAANANQPTTTFHTWQSFSLPRLKHRAATVHMMCGAKFMDNGAPVNIVVRPDCIRLDHYLIIRATPEWIVGINNRQHSTYVLFLGFHACAFVCNVLACLCLASHTCVVCCPLLVHPLAVATNKEIFQQREINNCFRADAAIALWAPAGITTK